MLRAQRHSDADFLPTLYYVIRKHAIDSDRGEQHRDRGEAAKSHIGARFAATDSLITSFMVRAYSTICPPLSRWITSFAAWACILGSPLLRTAIKMFE